MSTAESARKRFVYAVLSISPSVKASIAVPVAGHAEVIVVVLELKIDVVFDVMMVVELTY